MQAPDEIPGRLFPPVSSRPKPWEVGFFGLAVIGLLFGLGATTHGIRLATADDVAVARGLTDPAVALANRMYDFRIGRFYADAKFFILESLMRVPDEAWHSTIRIGAFLAAALAAAWFTWEWRRDARLALLVLVLCVGLVPVTVGYQALISIPLLWIGWAAVWAMGALAWRPDSIWVRSGIVAAFALAIVVHESNAAFLIWPALLRSRAGPAGREKFNFSEIAPCGLVLVAYGMLYLFVRHQALATMPGAGYQGTDPSLNLRETAFALNAFTWSGLPGFNSWLARSGDPAAAPFLLPLEWIGRMAANATAAGVAGAFVLGMAAWIGTKPGGREGELTRPLSIRPYCALLFAAFAPNLLLACTAKYQVWAHHRMWPYYYTSMSYLAWVVLLVTVISDALALIQGAAGRRAARAVVAAAVVLVAIGVTGSNREAAGLLRQHPFYHMAEFSRWFSTR